MGSLTVGFFIVTIIVMVLLLEGFSLGVDFSKLDYSNPRVLFLVKLVQSISSILMFLVPAFVFAYLSDPRPVPYLGLKRPLPFTYYLIAILIIVVSFPLVSWLSEINQSIHFPQNFSELEKMMRESQAKDNAFMKNVLRMHSTADFLSMIVVLAVLPAICEELFFRGVLQRVFIELTRRPWIGIFITALIFSAFHLQFLAFFPRFVLGIFLGALFWESGSLLPSILAHFVFNGIQIAIAYYAPHYMDKEPELSATLITGSTATLLLLTWWMRKISQTSYAEVYDTDDDFPIGPRDNYIA